MLFICTNYNKWVLDDNGCITSYDVIIVEADDELDCLGKGQFPLHGDDGKTEMIEV